VAEGESPAEVGVDHQILKVDYIPGRLSGQSLLFSDQDHSKSLPDAPHDDKSFLARLFETLNRSRFRKKRQSEYSVAKSDDEGVKNVPPADLVTCWVTHVLLTADKLDSAHKVDSNQQIKDEL